MALSAKAIDVLNRKEIKIRVIRSGMYQKLTFSVRKERMGDVEYYELYTERLIDASELTRIANEMELPVRAQNGQAFPSGKSARDFQVASSTS